MTVEIFGMKVRIPKGYTQTEDGTFVNGHGTEYGIVEYGRGKNTVIFLESISGEYDRRIELKKEG